MATTTQTVVRPSRTYDYLYDPTFVVSSQRDHAKESFKAHTSVDRIRCVPYFRTMFSSLRHYPRQGITLDSTDPVPAHVSRSWRGFPNQARETLLRYKKFNYDPSVQVPPQQFSDAKVGGAYRFKYFRRPIIPFLPQMPPSVVLAPTKRVDPLAPPISGQDGPHPPATPLTRNAQVQTDYRESETQTEPYSPDYVVRPGSQPELLTLATLSYGQGLPAGLSEVEMIERARAKRQWEATLPDLCDLSQLEKRRAMMEEQERKEWAFRESQITKVQEERLGVVRDLLKQREADHSALNDRRLEHLWSKRQAEKDRKIRRLRSDHVKALRKLTSQSRSGDGRLVRPSATQQYTSFDSQVYAPMTRSGAFLDSNADQYTVKNRYNTTLEGLLELEDSLPDYVSSPLVKAPQPSARPLGGKARQRAKLGAVLEQVHSQLSAEKKTKGQGSAKPLRFLERVEKPVPRPATPTLYPPAAGEEERELAVILLQRMLRGRAIQNKMFEGKERRKDLIAELCTTHALQSQEQKVKKLETQELELRQAKAKRDLHKEATINDGVENPAALELGRQLDYLSKELVRLQEERRVHAFVLLAERERRSRESEESGSRQREERLRRTHDEIFKQMMHVHQASVSSYLEDVILGSLQQTADSEARKEVRHQATLINTLAQHFQHTEESGRELVAEMVYSFLLPEVEKQTMRERVHKAQRKHLLAAHRILHREGEGLLLSLPNKGEEEPVPNKEEEKPPV